jgi:NADH dehydrogenase/NADH:ubiquinone oxidoreductase subunit G
MTMKDIKLKIDNKEITTTSDKTIFQAAVDAGIYIPSLCEHPDLPSSGECGLCLVEVKGESEPVLSCITKVTSNMVVKTDTSALRQKQRAVMEQILLHHQCLYYLLAA